MKELKHLKKNGEKMKNLPMQDPSSELETLLVSSWSSSWRCHQVAVVGAPGHWPHTPLSPSGSP